MAILKHIIVTLLWLGTIPPAIAQSTSFQHDIFGARNGLISPKIYALAQSTNRLLWIGTELGISMYNGYQFTNYQYTGDNDIIGRVLAIAEDSLHGIWMGGDKGLFYCHQGSIVKVTLPVGRPLAVESLLTDHEGNLWVGDIEALFRIEASELKRSIANDRTAKKLSPYAGFNKRAFALTSDKQHHVYVAGFDAVYVFDGGKESFKILWNNTSPQFPIRSICAASPDSLYWSNNMDMPVQCIKGRPVPLGGSRQIGRKVFLHQGKPLVLTTSNVSEITSSHELAAMFTYDSSTRHGHTAITDIEGNIWVGTWEGLHRFRKTGFVQHRLLSTENTEVFSMLERKNGDLLFGGNRGKLFLNTPLGILLYPGVKPLFPLAEVLTLYETDQAALWAGSGYEGISKLQAGTVTSYAPQGHLKDNNCEMLYPAGNGTLFACTENGVTVIDPNLSQPFVAHYAFQNQYTRYPELFGCLRIPAGPTWFYGSQGLFRLNDKGLLIADSIEGMDTKNMYINKAIADKQGQIWVATLGKGLLKCAIKNNRLTIIAVFDHHNLPSDNALSVLEDDNGNIWCADYLSLTRLQRAGNGFEPVSFFEKDGLLSSAYPTLKLEKQTNGKVWMLTTMGLLSFHPDSINLNVLPPLIMLNSITAYTAGNTNAREINTATVVTLPYYENNLEIDVTAICLTDPSKIKYGYRLLGLDSTWIYSAGRTMAFRFLKPGKYMLQVSACNNNGVWTQHPLQYSFIVTPPFWQTAWFIGLSAVVVALVVVMLFKRRVAAVKTKAAIQQQMAELEAKAIRAQMNPHFIFNSLNAIQESIVMNDYDTSYQYLSKFSKLLRMVLVYSEQNMIPLRDEMEMNRLYLELESLRFRHSFSYSIIADDDIDVNNTLFPSILVQPLIENAVWHGLLPKEGHKALSIVYSLKDNMLTCTIDDNGIGREKAEAIKKQKLGARFFESKATGLVKQRIKLFEQTGTVKANLEIIDKKDNKGEAIGTKVIISIPISSSYNAFE